MKDGDYTLKKLEEIEEHFANITEEEFERNLIKAGFGKINPLAEYGLEISCKQSELEDE